MRQPDYERGNVRMWLGDCMELLPQMEAGSVDCVVTDPPYGIEYASNWQTAMDGGPRKNRASFGADKLDTSWVRHAFAAQKPDGYFYCFTRWDVMGEWTTAIKAAGYKVAQRLVWDKLHWKMGDLRNYGSQTEDILLSYRGSPSMFPGGAGRRGNVFRCSASFLPEGQSDHPTQKPEELLRIFITDGCKPGGIVLDPFMGSGTTIVAAVQTGRAAWGIEIDPAYFDIAVKRVEQAQRQMRMEI